MGLEQDEEGGEEGGEGVKGASHAGPCGLWEEFGQVGALEGLYAGAHGALWWLRWGTGCMGQG